MYVGYYQVTRRTTYRTLTRAIVERCTRELGTVFTSPLLLAFANVIINTDAT